MSTNLKAGGLLISRVELHERRKSEKTRKAERALLFFTETDPRDSPESWRFKFLISQEPGRK